MISAWACPFNNDNINTDVDYTMSCSRQYIVLTLEQVFKTYVSSSKSFLYVTFRHKRSFK